MFCQCVLAALVPLALISNPALFIQTESVLWLCFLVSDPLLRNTVAQTTLASVFETLPLVDHFLMLIPQDSPPLEGYLGSIFEKVMRDTAIRSFCLSV